MDMSEFNKDVTVSISDSIQVGRTFVELSPEAYENGACYAFEVAKYSRDDDDCFNRELLDEIDISDQLILAVSKSEKDCDSIMFGNLMDILKEKGYHNLIFDTDAISRFHFDKDAAIDSGYIARDGLFHFDSRWEEDNGLA